MADQDTPRQLQPGSPQQSILWSECSYTSCNDCPRLLDERSGVDFAWGGLRRKVFGCESLGGKGTPATGCSRWSINACGEWKIADDVTRLCMGASSMGKDPPVTDPSGNIALLSRSSVHDDELSTFRVQCVEPSLVEIKRLPRTATCMIPFLWKM